MRLPVMPAAVFTALLCILPDAPAADWPQWRGPNRDGISSETNWTATWPEDGPKELWRASVGSGYSAVSVVGQRLYTMGNAETYTSGKDSIWCLETETGKSVWQYSYASKPGPFAGPRSTPTVDGDVLFTMSRYGDIFCLNVKDGSVVWKKNARDDFKVKKEPSGWGLACSPLVLGNKLLLDLGQILILDKKTGALVSSFGEDEPSFSSPVVFDLAGRTLVTSFNAFGLVVHDMADRKEIGRYKWQNKYNVCAVTPIVSGDSVFISSGYDKGCALLRVSLQGLTPTYENTNTCNDCSTSVLYKGHLYGVSGNVGKKGTLQCLDFATGVAKWEKGGFQSGGGLMVADGKIIHMEDKGELVVAAATPEGYKEFARAKVLDGICWTMPVLANGHIYCRNSKGTLVCLDVLAK